MKIWGILIMVIGAAMIVDKVGWQVYLGMAIFMTGDKIYDLKRREEMKNERYS